MCVCVCVCAGMSLHVVCVGVQLTNVGLEALHTVSCATEQHSVLVVVDTCPNTTDAIAVMALGTI